MRISLLAGIVVMLLHSGCAFLPPRRVALNYSRYHDPEFAWNAVSRIVLMPLVNETIYPRAHTEMSDALSAELQRLGLFEVVVAPCEKYEHLSKKVRENGRFDEGELAELARCFRADVIILGTVSQYQPYQRPRIGLVLQGISPDTGKVIASVDGLWDSISRAVADRAVRFYARHGQHLEKACDYALGNLDTAYAAEVVLESPHLFRRFVAFEAAVALVLKLIPLEALPPVVKAGAGGGFHDPKPMLGKQTSGGILGHFKKQPPPQKPGEPGKPDKQPDPCPDPEKQKAGQAKQQR